MLTDCIVHIVCVLWGFNLLPFYGLLKLMAGNKIRNARGMNSANIFKGWDEDASERVRLPEQVCYVWFSIGSKFICV